MKSEALAETVRAAPPVGVGGLALWGIPLNEWVLLATLVYTVFLIVDKFPTVVARCRTFVRWLKEKKDGESN